VRIGLLVGIGGAAPNLKNDIRLGDIVVSSARDGNPAVFQYDFGKTIQGQSFQSTQFLDRPPMALRTAVSDIKADYLVDGHRIQATIDEILEKKPKLRKTYRRPDQTSDRLYAAKFVHLRHDGADSVADCSVACGDDPEKLILRPERAEEDDNPAIHYGLIASANQVMKDALIRDKLATEKSVLRFEMEAAGLMNHFPCLIIRGICDYSDSHKNKAWQGYAAMAAAAFAKDLLSRVSLNRVKAEKPISEIISSG
jgi:nucleoside phosphorylase